jgi:hypothetical protein
MCYSIWWKEGNIILFSHLTKVYRKAKLCTTLAHRTSWESKEVKGALNIALGAQTPL